MNSGGALALATTQTDFAKRLSSALTAFVLQLANNLAALLALGHAGLRALRDKQKQQAQQG